MNRFFPDKALIKRLMLMVFLVSAIISAGIKDVRALRTSEQKKTAYGVWVTVFSGKRILYSRQAISDLIAFCKNNAIDEIYLQIYRGGQAYYDSGLAGRERYEEMIKSTGSDPIDFLLSEGKKNNLKVYAWINVLSLAQNKQAPILRKYGAGVLTRDQRMRPSIRSENIDGSDKYYLRDDQIFLEPGDERVVDFTLSVVGEIIGRYPSFNGIHLDYIRYPYPVPFIPDSRFIKFGLSYGYGERNLERFKEATGSDPLNDDMDKNSLYLKWDNWKRGQVTNLVKNISGLVREQAKNWKISCAAVPTPERAYAIAFQDWPFWLERGYIDYAVLMNYTRDARLLIETSRSVQAHRHNGKVYVGLGAFLLKDKKEELTANLRMLEDLGPDGIVFFSYDDICDGSMPRIR